MGTLFDSNLSLGVGSGQVAPEGVRLQAPVSFP